MRRRLQYWRAFTRDGHPATTPKPIDIIETLVNARQRNIDRHWECQNGMTVLAHPAPSKNEPVVILDRVRTGNYPSAGDANGNRRRIPLGRGEVLLEPTYVMFLEEGYIAVLTGGDGPHAQRLAEYLRIKFNADWWLEPVLRDNLDEVLEEMRITEISISVPADLISRDLVGGDWYQALEAGKQLTEDGMVRIGLSVGQKGDRSFKEQMSEKYHDLVSSLRQAIGLQDFKTASVMGVRNGNRQMINLIEDQLVESVDVEDDKWFDSDKSVEYATNILRREVSQGPHKNKKIDAIRGADVIAFDSRRSDGPETD